jgi:hypothetical protein
MLCAQWSSQQYPMCQGYYEHQSFQRNQLPLAVIDDHGLRGLRAQTCCLCTCILRPVAGDASRRLP